MSLKTFLDDKKLKSTEFDSFITKEISKILTTEASAILNLVDNLPTFQIQTFISLILSSKQLVFSGIGKSGLVGQKLAATFSSLGISSIFLHPMDALHGDLGVVLPGSIFIALSKSGTGLELEQLIFSLKSNNVYTVLISCRDGFLSELVDLYIKLPFQKEADDFNFIPSTSSTLMLALGDAIAITVGKLKGFNEEVFARYHPGGAIGKNLVLTVDSFMYKDESLPFIAMETKFQDLILTITSKKLGVGIVVDSSKKLLGIITDGDLRRVCSAGVAIFEKKAFEIMSKNPKVILSTEKALTALSIMENYKITSLIVLDSDQNVVGLVHIHDLVKAGIGK